MNNDRQNGICEEAEQYYLSILFGGEYGETPDEIAAHVETCSHCRKQLALLKNRLSVTRSAELEENQLKAQIHILGLHFAYLGKEVRCDTVKPFLPSLLEPSLKARIPTPVTVHLDRCELCRQDLATIGMMGLTAKQLGTLNLIFSDKTSVSGTDCSVAADSIRLFVDFDFQLIEPEVLKHLCCCSVCQALIYKARQEKIESLHAEYRQTSFPCESVTFSDIFDYCFPYGLVSYGDEYASFRKPFVNELKSCAKCLQKVQDLHHQVFAIRQRPESGVVTVYEMGEVPGSGVTQTTEGNYCGFPIKVRMSGASENLTPDKAQQQKGARKRTHIFRRGFKHLAKIAAAAVVIFAVAFFWRNMPRAAALTIQQVYDALQKAVNVHIQQFAAEGTKPVQEKWISRDRGIFAIRDGNSYVVWDAAKGTKQSRLADSAGRETVPLTELESAAIRKRTEGSLGLMPFENASQAPQNAKWQELSVAEVNSLPANMQVYELTWTRVAEDRSVVRFKWRGYIDGDTNRPVRTEFYICDGTSGQYKLRTVRLIEYWTESQMKCFLQRVLP
jgi:hypothetical protein